MEIIREKIIVVDDSSTALQSLQSILSPFYEVHCFQDQNKIVERVCQINPALVLLDIIMPVSGFDIMADLKAEPLTRDIPVIFMTTPQSNGEDENEERSFRLGAVDFIPKPLRPSVVLARVRSHVELYQYFRRLETITITDALTEVYNRRGFNDMLVREWCRIKRENSDLSLLMIDIDNFKNFNDNYGHQGGDNTLRLVGQAIKRTLLRATDVPARYGGEEFAVILPGANEKGAQVVAENMLRAVRELHITHAYSGASQVVTVSIGIATANDNMPNPDSLIKTADDMLYKAKESGRNRFYPVKEIILYE